MKQTILRQVSSRPLGYFRSGIVPSTHTRFAMKGSWLSLILWAFISLNAANGQEYTLIWSDECGDSGAVDATKWFHQTQLPNGDSWFNGEIQHYTDRGENAYYSNGFMHIRAVRETYVDQGVTKSFTSARLNSKMAFTYGKVEVRAKLPFGVGTWPAVWMLGQNINEPGAYWQPSHGNTSWPACGEIDIMEHWGSNQNYVSSALHTPSSSGATVNVGGTLLSNVSDSFHVYAMEWTDEFIAFSVDGVVHYTYQPSTKNSATWPFDAPQYILLNVAIQSNIDTGFTESEMVIDYVRVYQSDLNGTEELEQGSIELFPNPVDASFRLKVPDRFIGAECRLQSADGRALQTQTLLGNDVIDASDLSAGVYWVRVEGRSGEALVKRFLVR
jgi:beta-glucanase (GH16 family)